MIENKVSNGLHLFDDRNVSRRVEPWVKGRGPAGPL